MKSLELSSEHLIEIFSLGVTAKYIAESLRGFDVNHPVDEVLEFMDDKGYDVVGVTEEGIIIGYVEKTKISGNSPGKCYSSFETKSILPDTAPLTDVFVAFSESPRVFVSVFGQVGGIITPADLQKFPVRIYLFGLISLIEMQMLRIIKERYPKEEWKSLLTQKRLDDANRILTERRNRNADIGLADCLQLCDKGDILRKDNELFESISSDSKGSFKDLMKKLENLRNELAHAQYMAVWKDWSEFAQLVKKAQGFLDILKSV